MPQSEFEHLSWCFGTACASHRFAPACCKQQSCHDRKLDRPCPADTAFDNSGLFWSACTACHSSRSLTKAFLPLPCHQQSIGIQCREESGQLCTHRLRRCGHHGWWLRTQNPVGPMLKACDLCTCSSCRAQMDRTSDDMPLRSSRLFTLNLNADD